MIRHLWNKVKRSLSLLNRQSLMQDIANVSSECLLTEPCESNSNVVTKTIWIQKRVTFSFYVHLRISQCTYSRSVQNGFVNGWYSTTQSCSLSECFQYLNVSVFHNNAWRRNKDGLSVFETGEGLCITSKDVMISLTIDEKPFIRHVKALYEITGKLLWMQFDVHKNIENFLHLCMKFFN